MDWSKVRLPDELPPLPEPHDGKLNDYQLWLLQGLRLGEEDEIRDAVARKLKAKKESKEESKEEKSSE